ncbi:uncharacterized protein LOC111024288 [Momordica charantia]|uniref:Uncharacterized protein LOC111024288 n=1 Tax=Momordica charantia TaxID=3673 RepID=A0A6J1DYR5_MOMCH|nr:uncharacterized protein LOC111024288 [Momordica charantia]
MTKAETRYPQMEKLALTLVTSTRRLRPCFQAHTVTVLTNLPLKQVLHKSKTSDRLMKSAVELSKYDIQFEPQTAVKGQVVTDFIGELTLSPTPTSEFDQLWMMYVYESSNEKGCGAGVLFLAPDDIRFEYALRFYFRTSNNEAEYEALLAVLRMTRGLGASHLQIFSDSQLIVNQIKEEYKTKDSRMEKYLGKVRSHLTHFQAYEISKIPRSQNSNVDVLAKLASAYKTNLARSVLVKILDNPSILELDMMEVDSKPLSWMDPIRNFLEGNIPINPKEAKKMRRKTARYLLRDETMYQRGFSLPLLKCISKEDESYVLKEVHEGVCGNHLGARSLSTKVIRQGYYWPTVDQDAKEFVKACDNCQRFANIIHQPPELLTPISTPWPFAQWGVDLIGPFPLGKGQTKFELLQALLHKVLGSRSPVWTRGPLLGIPEFDRCKVDLGSYLLDPFIRNQKPASLKSLANSSKSGCWRKASSRRILLLSLDFASSSLPFSSAVLGVTDF